MKASDVSSTRSTRGSVDEEDPLSKLSLIELVRTGEANTKLKVIKDPRLSKRAVIHGWWKLNEP